MIVIYKNDDIKLVYQKQNELKEALEIKNKQDSQINFSDVNLQKVNKPVS